MKWWWEGAQTARAQTSERIAGGSWRWRIDVLFGPGRRCGRQRGWRHGRGWGKTFFGFYWLCLLLKVIYSRRVCYCCTSWIVVLERIECADVWRSEKKRDLWFRLVWNGSEAVDADDTQKEKKKVSQTTGMVALIQIHFPQQQNNPNKQKTIKQSRVPGSPEDLHKFRYPILRNMFVASPSFSPLNESMETLRIIHRKKTVQSSGSKPKSCHCTPKASDPRAQPYSAQPIISLRRP